MASPPHSKWTFGVQGAWQTGACATGADYLRACKGGHQGCPLATNLCCLPYFVALSQVQERYPDVRIASFADDAHLKYTAITNMAHRPEVLYEG